MDKTASVEFQNVVIQSSSTKRTTYLSGDALEGATKGADENLLFSTDRPRIIMQVRRQRHLDGTTAGNNAVVLGRAAHNHDGIVNGALGLVEELLAASTQNHSSRLGSRTLGKKIIALFANLHLLEETTCAENLGCQTIRRGLQLATGGLRHAFHVGVGHATSAKNVPLLWLRIRTTMLIGCEKREYGHQNKHGQRVQGEEGERLRNTEWPSHRWRVVRGRLERRS